MSKKPRGRPAIHSNNEYVRAKKEEFMICRTPGCRNAIATWATGTVSNGYCTLCRGERAIR